MRSTMRSRRSLRRKSTGDNRFSEMQKTARAGEMLPPGPRVCWGSCRALPRCDDDHPVLAVLGVGDGEAVALHGVDDLLRALGDDAGGDVEPALFQQARHDVGQRDDDARDDHHSFQDRRFF